MFTIVGLCGCFGNDSNSEFNKFIGAWKHGTLPNSGILIFYSNGSCIYRFDTAEWEVKNKQLIIDFPNSNVTFKFNYKFLDNNQILELENVETSKIEDYKKQ